MSELREILERLLERRDLSEAEAGGLLVALTDADGRAGDGGRAARGTALEGRHAGRGARLRAARCAGSPGAPSCRPDRRPSTSSAPAATRRAASICRPARRCWWPRWACASSSTAIARSRAAPAARTCSRRWGSACRSTSSAAGECLAATGFTFLFAPHYHPAMKEVAPVRRALGVRTVFNLLGPLTNPAEPPFSLIGAYSAAAAKLMAETLAGMPIERVFVVHGEPGWDEATPVGPFELYDVRPGRVGARSPRCARVRHWSVQRGGSRGRRCRAQRGGSARRVRGRDRGPHRDAVVLNAALALEVTGAVPSAAAGRAGCVRGDRRGDAQRLLERLADFGRRSSRHADPLSHHPLPRWACSPTCSTPASGASPRLASAFRKRRCGQRCSARRRRRRCGSTATASTSSRN